MTPSVNHPERALFVGMYATKLKELPDAPYRCRPIQELERIAERCLEAVQKALEGDYTGLERYLSHIVLQLGREGFRSWQLIKGFDVFHDTAKRLPEVFSDPARVNDVLYWAIVRFSQLYEELQTVQGLSRMVESLTMALDSKEQHTSSHCHAVQKVAEKIAKVLSVDISMAALLHDVGKIHIPDRILAQHGPLSREDWSVLQQHPYHSFRIISPIDTDVASICLRHHERPDGRGYPLGETEVRVEANTIAAADTLHAICNKPAYPNHQRLDIALRTIRANRGTQFLPEVVDAIDRVYGDVAGLLATFSPAIPASLIPHGTMTAQA